MTELKLPDETLRVETVCEDDFSADRGEWLFEGTRRVAFRDGRLFVDATGDEHDQYATFWCRQYFEGDGAIEYVWRSETDPPEGRNNLNFFVYATMLDGSSVLDTTGRRTGAYGEYHEFNNYIYTYLSGNPEDVAPADPTTGRTRVRFRKDPGFNLVREAWVDGLIERGRDYHFTVLIQGPRMRFYADGRKIFDHEDAAAPHRRGHHGFRTWHSHVSCRLFRVSRLLQASRRGQLP